MNGDPLLGVGVVLDLEWLAELGIDALNTNKEAANSNVLTVFLLDGNDADGLAGNVGSGDESAVGCSDHLDFLCTCRYKPDGVWD